MVAEKSIDIVTICFLDELKMLQMQARSIVLHLDERLVGRYIVIVNDDRLDECFEFIETVVKPELSWLAPKLLVVAPGELGLAQQGAGWSTQQILKLAVSRMVGEAHYLILDAKNHFIRNVRISDLFDQATGKPRARVYQSSGARTQWLENGLRYFGVDHRLAKQQSGATVTPYLVVTDLVRRMLGEMDGKHQGGVAGYFSETDEDQRSSEFFLYYAFIAARCGSYADIYSCDLPAQATLFTQHPRTKDKLERIMKSAERGVSFMFAVHRRRLAALDPALRERVLALWKKAGLIGPGEEQWFMTPYVAPGGASQGDAGHLQELQAGPDHTQASEPAAPRSSAAQGVLGAVREFFRRRR